MANRYWVAGLTNNWSDTTNWSTTSGGVGGASVPGAADDAIFDANGAGHDCTLDQNVNVNSWTYATSTYSGTIDCVTFDVTTAGNLWGRGGGTRYMGTGTFNVGGSFSGRDTNLYGQTATLRFTTMNGGLSLSNQQQDTGPYLEVASGAKCVYYFNGQRDVKGFDCAGEFVNTVNYNSLDVYGDIAIRSSGKVTNSGADFYLVSLNTDNPTVLLESGADVGDVIFGTYRSNPSTPKSITYTGAGWATATGATLSLSYQTTTSGNWTHIFPSSINVREVRLGPRYSSSKTTLDFSTNSTQLTVQRHFSDISTYGADTYDINVGTSSLTFALAEDGTFSPRGNVFPPIIVGDNAVGTLTLDSNVTTPYVHDCANQIDENGYTVTTTGTDPSPCSTGTRYWVGLVDTDYENTGNWSTSSGGLGNASVPVGTNNVVFDSGSSANCVMTASRSAASFDAQSGYTGAIDFSASNMRCIGNFTLDHGGGMDFGSGTHYMGGFFDVKDCGTLDYATSSVELAGTGTNMLTWSATDTNKPFYDVIVSGNLTTNNVPYAAIRATNSYTISGTLAHNATGGRQTLIQAGALVVSGTLTGSGDCAIFTTASGAASLTISGSGSVTIGKLKASLGGVTGSYVEIGAGDYSSCDVEMATSNNVSDAPLRFSGDVTLKSLNFTTSSGANMVVQNSTHNPSITLKGDLTCTTSNVTWSAGTGTIILDNVISQSIDFNGQTVEGIHVTDASTGSIVLANNFSTAWLRDCNSLIDLNGYTITNADTEDRCAYPYDPPTTIALDSSKAITTDLQAWWPLVDGSGTSPSDISGNSEGLATTNSPSWGVNERGNFLRTSVKTGYYSTNNPFSTIIGGTTPATDNFSISFWASMYGTAPYEYEDGIFSIGSTATDGSPFFVFQRDQSSGVRFYWGGGWTFLHSLSNYQWGHYVFTFDGTQMDSYVDGTYNSTRSSSGTFGSTSDKFWVGVGYNNTGGNDVADFLQNVRIWSRALTSTEVASLYSDPWIGSDYTAVVPLTNVWSAVAHFQRLG